MSEIKSVNQLPEAYKLQIIRALQMRGIAPTDANIIRVARAKPKKPKEDSDWKKLSMIFGSAALQGAADAFQSNVMGKFSDEEEGTEGSGVYGWLEDWGGKFSDSEKGTEGTGVLGTLEDWGGSWGSAEEGVEGSGILGALRDIWEWI